MRQCRKIVGPRVMRKKGSRATVDAMLRHLGCGNDLENFPGTRYEQLALIRTAASRGLVEWQEERARYALTPTGSPRLAPRRWLSLASLAAGTAIGTIGAAALAVVWLPGDAAHRSVDRQATAPLSRPLVAGGGLRTSAPLPQTASASRAALSAQPDTPTEPAKVAEQPVPEEPIAEAAPTVVKQATVKRSRQRTGPGPTWAFANPYRDERYSGRGLFR
jgi:hypothetical protein